MRRALLLLIAVVFAGIAIASLLEPDVMAAQLGYRLDSIDARNEYRAIYVGLWLATAAYFWIAAARVSQPILGDLGALLILGQTAGRVLSLALDGLPTAQMWPPFFIEAAGGLALLVLRPEQPIAPAPGAPARPGQQ
jgi:hypothetical protein